MAGIDVWTGLGTVFGSGGLVAVIVAFISQRRTRKEVELDRQKIKQDEDRLALDRMELEQKAKRLATEASTAAVASMATALGQQEKRLTTQGQQITDLSTRLTDNERVRLVAVEHIADRETFAISYWEKRPKGLPKIPALIHSEVLATAPHLRIAQMEHGGDGPDDSVDDEEDEEDTERE